MGLTFSLDRNSFHMELVTLLPLSLYTLIHTYFIWRFIWSLLFFLPFSHWGLHQYVVYLHNDVFTLTFLLWESCFSSISIESFSIYYEYGVLLSFQCVKRVTLFNFSSRDTLWSLCNAYIISISQSWLKK